VTPVAPARHLLRAKDLVDARYRDPLDVAALARAALLRNTDRSVAEICLTVGLRSVGSFTTTFTRTFGRSPTAYRAAHPPAAGAFRSRRAWCSRGRVRNAARLEKTAPPRATSVASDRFDDTGGRRC
jgi:AraC-like DNA-binding protein